jgi:hypothetical protein
MYGNRRSSRWSKTSFGLVALSLVLGLLLAAALPSSAAAPALSAPMDQEDPGTSPSSETSTPPGGLGMVPSSADKQGLVGLPEMLGAAEELPEAVDLTESDSLLQGQPSGDGIASIGDQGQTATCTGWAASYYYKTYQEWLEHGWDLEDGGPDYDYIFSPSFVYNQITNTTDWNCDEGAQIGDAIALIVEQGDLPWSEFPWVPYPYDCGTQPSSAEKDAAEEYDGISYGAFFIDVGPPYGPELDHDLTPLKQWLANDDPFVLGFPIYSEFDYYDCYEVVTPPAYPGSYRGLHAVAVVGYDNNWAGVGGFKIVNSYGDDWGCYGYAWLSYSFVRQYAWEAWWMTSNRPPWIDPDVPDRYSPSIGGTIMVDLTRYENDLEDGGTDLDWYAEGADHCVVYGEGSANDVLQFQPSPTGYTGYDEITLVLRDSDDAEDRQELMLGWFDLNIEQYLPLVLR